MASQENTRLTFLQKGDTTVRSWGDGARRADYLMSIHERLPRQIGRELKQVGWSKAAELVMPMQQFRDEVEKHLTGESEPSDLIYFKLYRSQVSIIEQALETAARMLGSDRSRGYCLEMICADFLAAANLENGNPDVLLMSLERWFHFLPIGQQQRFIRALKLIT